MSLTDITVETPVGTLRIRERWRKRLRGIQRLERWVEAEAIEGHQPREVLAAAQQMYRERRDETWRERSIRREIEGAIRDVGWAPHVRQRHHALPRIRRWEVGP